MKEDTEPVVSYSWCQEINSLIRGPEDFHYDLRNEIGKTGYQNVFLKEKIKHQNLNSDIREVFNKRPDLFCAFHITSLCVKTIPGRKKSVSYTKTKVYYFRYIKSLLDFIEKMEYETFLSMDKENLAKNSFIHFN